MSRRYLDNVLTTRVDNNVYDALEEMRKEDGDHTVSEFRRQVLYKALVHRAILKKEKEHEPERRSRQPS